MSFKNWISEIFNRKEIESYNYPTCKTCGEYAFQTLDGIGACCSQELRDQNTRLAEYEKHKRDLVFALQSRVLTDQEMGEVASYDYSLLTTCMIPYSETEVRRQFSDLLLTQFKIRAAASNANPSR